MQPVKTHKAPNAVGPYSQAVLKNNMLFVSGQLGIDPSTNLLPESFTAQAQQVFTNLKGVLEAAGMTFAQVVKVSIFLQNLNDFGELNEIYAQYFSEPYPSRETVQVARLPKDGKVEISLIALK